VKRTNAMSPGEKLALGDELLPEVMCGGILIFRPR
jgi:hypothetical protein